MFKETDCRERCDVSKCILRQLNISYPFAIELVNETQSEDNVRYEGVPTADDEKHCPGAWAHPYVLDLPLEREEVVVRHQGGNSHIIPLHDEQSAAARGRKRVI